MIKVLFKLLFSNIQLILAANKKINKIKIDILSKKLRWLKNFRSAVKSEYKCFKNDVNEKEGISLRMKPAQLNKIIHLCLSSFYRDNLKTYRGTFNPFFDQNYSSYVVCQVFFSCIIADMLNIYSTHNRRDLSPASISAVIELGEK